MQLITKYNCSAPGILKPFDDPLLNQTPGLVLVLVTILAHQHKISHIAPNRHSESVNYMEKGHMRCSLV